MPNNYRDRLTEDAKIEIHSLYNAGIKPTEIARRYRVPPIMVSKILHKDGRSATGSRKESQMSIATKILTPDVVAKIEASTISIKAVARQIGVTAPIVAKHINKRSERIRKAMENYTAESYKNDGRADGEIAFSFGVSPSFFTRWKQANGIKTKPRKTYPKDLPMDDRAWYLVQIHMRNVKYYLRPGVDESFVVKTLERSAAISAHRGDSDPDAKRYLSKCMRFAALKVYRSTQERFEYADITPCPATQY
jgi:transposase